MPTIADFSYGFDATGVDDYLTAIKADYIEKAKEAVLDISGITKVCDNEWEGQARENFKVNLKNDAQHVADQFDALYLMLRYEINSIATAMDEKDQKLIDID